MTRRIERPTSSKAPEARVEVRVRRDGKPYRKVRLSKSPASIGRSSDADVVLDSNHVSRVHAHLHFNGPILRLVDAGSTNGFEVRGRRLRQATIAKGDVVDICGFQIEVRWLSRLPAAVENELSEGWGELEEQDEADATFVGESPLLERGGGRVEPLHQDPTIPVGSMINRLAYRKEALAAVIDEDIDPDELEEYLQPDLPPLLVTLHEEANELLYNELQTEVSVEVIHVIGDRIYNVDLLAPGQECWWGGAPVGAEHLWV
ncbi:MAG: FHA domain-containing protein, partial [Myxococcota bacterium]